MICRATPRSLASGRDSFGVAGAVDAEAEAPDAPGYPPAVADQVVEGPVALAVHVHLAAVDQIVEGRQRDREATGHICHRHQHRIVAVVGIVAGEGGHILAGIGQGRHLVGGRAVAVADVVDAASQGIDGAHGLALGRRQELDPIGKVPSLGGGDLLATEVGLVEIHAASASGQLRSPPGPRAPEGGGQVEGHPPRRRPGRSPEGVETAIGHGIEGGLPPGPETGHGPPGPAVEGAG